MDKEGEKTRREENKKSIKKVEMLLYVITHSLVAYLGRH